MKKFLLLFTAAGLMLGGTVFAQEDNGALGFGIMSESNKSGVVSTASSSLRGSMFLDAGSKLFGPFYYGFEFQGDVKRLSESSFDMSQTDMAAFGLGGGDYVIFVQTSNYTTTYTLWDLDVSPRGYLSFDLGSKIQLLGFGGLNYNWQTLDVKTTNKSGGTRTINGQSIADGSDYTTSNSTGGTFDLIAGFRVSVGAFYVDYTRFLSPDTTGNYSFDKYNKNRWGLGINLRF
jgi:hypothetical protein